MNFFSREAGQERRQWLNALEAEIADNLRYYLGPDLAPRVDALAGGAQMLNPVNDMTDSMAAAGQGDYWDSVVAAAPVAAPLAAGKVLSKMGANTADDAARWLEEALAGWSATPEAVAGRNFLADESGNLALKPKTAGQQQAQEILDYLAQGRGAEVTDDMMAAADDAYLFNNYDMPMDEASRMARAREMGFDTDTPLFHGGLTPHQSVRPITDTRSRYEDIGAGTYYSDSHHGPGYYTTTSPRDASGNYGSVDGPDIRNKIETRYERILEMDFDQLADEIRLTLSPEDIEALDPKAARLLREVNAKTQNNLTTGDTEEWENYISGSEILNDLADLTARRQVGATDGFVNPVYGRAKNPVRTKNPDSTFFDRQMDLQDPKDFLDEAGGDEDLAFDLALEASYDLERVGPLEDGINALFNSVQDAGMDEESWKLANELRDASLDYGGLNAADFEHIVRNSDAGMYGIDYDISPGGLVNEAYRAMGHDAIDLHSPTTTFTNMPNLEGTAFHRVFTDPTAVRSRFARFDPRLAHLRNLSAGLAPVAFGVNYFSQDEYQ